MPLRQRIAGLCVRLAIVLIVAGAMLALPEPETDGVVRFKNAIVAFFTVIALGKVLYDTFFYDHFSL